jgi:hypothetical protein
MICCGMAGKRMGMLGVSVRKMKAVTEDGDSDTDWYTVTCFLYKCMTLKAKLFTLSRHFIFGESSYDLDKYIFPWQTHFIWGTILVTVILYSSKYSINKEH